MSFIKLLTDEAAALGDEWILQCQSSQTFSETCRWFFRRAFLGTPDSVRFIFQLLDEVFSTNSVHHTDHLHHLIRHYLNTSISSPLRFILVFLRPFIIIFPKLSRRIIQRVVAYAIQDYLTIYHSESDLESLIAFSHTAGTAPIINVLGESIFSEPSAAASIETYSALIRHVDIEYIAVKLSHLTHLRFSIDQRDLIAEYATKLITLFDEISMRKANDCHSMINLTVDLENDHDHLASIAAFKQAVSITSNPNLNAGIAIQAYSKDSFIQLKELTEWSKKRVKSGQNPIHVRIIKGANLALETIHSSQNHWNSPIYSTKLETDANFKRLLLFALDPQHAPYVHVGVGSHNIYDCAFSYCVAKANQTLPFLHFELLQGMHPSLNRILKTVAPVRLYSPIVAPENLMTTSAYMSRRLIENTAEDHFLCHLIYGKKFSDSFLVQMRRAFIASSDRILSLPYHPLRYLSISRHSDFQNTPTTPWHSPYMQSLLVSQTLNRTPLPPPIISSKTSVPSSSKGSTLIPCFSPNHPRSPLYHCDRITAEHLEEVIQYSHTHHIEGVMSDDHNWVHHAIRTIHSERFRLLNVIALDVGKSYEEADHELNEGIDFLDCSQQHWLKQSSTLMHYRPLGVVVITAPWNFPFAISLGMITAALLTGNSIIFKPSPDAIWVGWELVCLLWEAGVSKQHLQFIICDSSAVGTQLIRHPLVKGISLTGSTKTAQLFSSLNSDCRLIAETGGKNTLTLSALTDHDLAISVLLKSCYSYSGQKCSAASIIFIEESLYNDTVFIETLCEAIESLPMGPSTSAHSYITPLIREPEDPLLFCLTSLEEGQSWLVKPQKHPDNPHLWSPGLIKGLAPHHRLFKEECFGPIAGLMPYSSFDEVIDHIQSIPYALTAGLVSLSSQEHTIWTQNVRVGNRYINQATVGAKVGLQPFGGMKLSSFNKSFKAGGPYYLFNFMTLSTPFPIPSAPKSMINDSLAFLLLLAKRTLSSHQVLLFTRAVHHYLNSATRKKWIRQHTVIEGEYNGYQLAAIPKAVIRIESTEKQLDPWLSIAAALACGAPVELSLNPSLSLSKLPFPCTSIHRESFDQFMSRQIAHPPEMIRMVSGSAIKPDWSTLQSTGCFIQTLPPHKCGDHELLNYLEEMTTSSCCHRYGIKHPPHIASLSAKRFV